MQTGKNRRVHEYSTRSYVANLNIFKSKILNIRHVVEVERQAASKYPVNSWATKRHAFQKKVIHIQKPQRPGRVRSIVRNDYGALSPVSDHCPHGRLISKWSVDIVHHINAVRQVDDWRNISTVVDGILNEQRVILRRFHQYTSEIFVEV